MLEQIAWIVLCAAIGAICVPVMMFALARFGYFPPIEVNTFGRRYRFAPPEPDFEVMPPLVTTTTVGGNLSIASSGGTVFYAIFIPKSAVSK